MPAIRRGIAKTREGVPVLLEFITSKETEVSRPGTRGSSQCARHSGAHEVRTRNPGIPRCAIAHLKFDAEPVIGTRCGPGGIAPE